MGLAQGANARWLRHLTMSEAKPPSDRKSEIRSIQGWRKLVLFPFGTLLRWWGHTLRFEASPETLRNIRKIDQPVAMVLWHNRLFLGAEIFRRYRQGRPVYALVSASSDGAWLEAFFAMAGLRTVRGSSSKLGREAVTALVDVMRNGNDIGITPDGPRGPRYDFKAGGLIVARRTGAPLLLLGGQFESAWQLKSWDGFYVPKPFSRVRFVCELVESSELQDRDAAATLLRERLLKINPDTRPEAQHL